MAGGPLAHPASPFQGAGVEVAGRLDTADNEGKGHRCSIKPRAPLSFLQTRLFQSYIMYKKNDYLRLEDRN